MPRERPIIAVTQRVVEVPARRERRDCLDQAWTTWLAAMELDCAPVPNGMAAPAAFVEALDPAGIILSGGNDLSREHYDRLEAGDLLDTQPDRDHTERAILDFALDRRVPLLACCRGMQFLHTYFGGRLVRVGGTAGAHVASVHVVDLADDGIRRWSGAEALEVNSYHRYGIPRNGLPAPLVPFAVSRADASVEGCFHPELPIAGVMWHPERANPAAAFDRALATRLFREAAGQFGPDFRAAAERVR